MNSSAHENDGSLNDFLNRLTDELRTHGSEADSVKTLLLQAEQNPGWRAPAEAAVRLRSAYENDELFLPRQSSEAASSPPHGKKLAVGQLFATILLVVLMGGLLIVMQSPSGGTPGSSGSSLPSDPKGNAADMARLMKGLQSATEEVQALKMKAAETLSASQESIRNYNFVVGKILPASQKGSIGELALLAALGEKVLDRTDPNTPKRFNVALYTGAGLRPMKGDLPEVSITETSEGPEKGVHIWGLGKKGWNQFDTKRKLTAEEWKEVSASFHELEKRMQSNGSVTVEEAVLALRTAYQGTLEKLRKTGPMSGDGEK